MAVDRAVGADHKLAIPNHVKVCGCLMWVEVVNMPYYPLLDWVVERDAFGSAGKEIGRRGRKVAMIGDRR